MIIQFNDLYDGVFFFHSNNVKEIFYECEKNVFYHLCADNAFKYC